MGRGEMDLDQSEPAHVRHVFQGTPDDVAGGIRDLGKPDPRKPYNEIRLPLGHAHNFPTPRLVEVNWSDSWSSHGWTERKSRLADLGEDAGICKTVGYVVEDTADRLTVAESLSKNGNVGCTTTIPRVCIVSINTLREARE